MDAAAGAPSGAPPSVQEPSVQHPSVLDASAPVPASGGASRRRVGTVSGSMVWLTPPAILEALGPFDLDPAAAPDPRPWPTARVHLTAADDGLRHEWFGRVWLNPPYGRALPLWLERLCRHGVGTALIFARTDTDAFFDMVWRAAAAAMFLRGRLRFHRPDGSLAQRIGGGADGGAPSVLVAYGALDADRLATSGLDGHFVPLAPASLVFVVGGGLAAEPATWRALLIEALTRRGGTATHAELYEAAERSRRAAGNRHVRAKVRQVLQALAAAGAVQRSGAVCRLAAAGGRS